jgi:hypothetical protein
MVGIGDMASWKEKKPQPYEFDKGIKQYNIGDLLPNYTGGGKVGGDTDETRLDMS